MNRRDFLKRIVAAPVAAVAGFAYAGKPKPVWGRGIPQAPAGVGPPVGRSYDTITIDDISDIPRWWVPDSPGWSPFHLGEDPLRASCREPICIWSFLDHDGNWKPLT